MYKNYILIDSDFKGNNCLNKDYLNEATKKSNTELLKVFKVLSYVKIQKMSLFLIAPMSETRIDSEVHYNEGDILTFNCSSNGDPNYSSASVELIKDFQTLLNIPGPYFGLEYKSNCSVDFNWIAYVPNPLTINQHDVIVRCVVKNSLLNEIRTSEKKLNVSAVGKF